MATSTSPTVDILIDDGQSRLYTVENWTPVRTSSLVNNYSFYEDVNGRKLFLDLYPYLATLPLQIEPPIKVYNKIVHQRRDVGFFSNESIGYRYSGQLAESSPLTPILSALMEDINSDFNTQFNGILVNRYANQTKYLSAHSDNESGLDKVKRSVIGIAYGGVRTFRIRNKNTKEIILDISHKPGMVIVMEGNFQKCFLHEVCKESKTISERISVTFRHHLE